MQEKKITLQNRLSQQINSNIRTFLLSLLKELLSKFDAAKLS